MSDIYLSLQAERIQAYISRSPRLRHARGASAMVAQAFRKLDAEVKQGCFAGVSLPDDALPIDGKTMLVIDPTKLEGDGEIDARVQQMVQRLVAKIRREAPALQVGASWAPSKSVAAFHAEVSPQEKTYLAPSLDLPLVRRCDLCGLDPVGGEISVGNTKDRVCVDCKQREYANRTRPTSGSAAENFSNLARFGPSADGRKTNHLATFKADGNRLGARFRQIGELMAGDSSDPAKTAEASAARKKLSEGVSNATIEAHRAAKYAVAAKAAELGELEQVPVVTHIMGGDDYLASLPAAYGFVFAKEYLETFERLATQAANDAGVLKKEGERITASGGLCIAHANHPFSAAADEAENLVGASKSQFQGEEASFNWINLTDTSTPINRPVTMAELNEFWDRLDELHRTLGNTRITNLARIYETQGEKALRADIQRVDGRGEILKLLDPWLYDDRSEPAIELTTALAMLKWWV